MFKYFETTIFLPIILFLGYNFISYQKKITLSCYSLMLSKRGFVISIMVESESFFIFFYSVTYNRIFFYNKFEFCLLSFLIYGYILMNKQVEFRHRSLKQLTISSIPRFCSTCYSVSSFNCISGPVPTVVAVLLVYTIFANFQFKLCNKKKLDNFRCDKL